MLYLRRYLAALLVLLTLQSSIAPVFAAYNSSGWLNYGVDNTTDVSVSLLTPTTPTTTRPTDTTLILGWTDNSSGETGYKIERAPDNAGSPGAWAQIGLALANATSYADSALTAYTTYHYRVRAYNGTNNSAYSTAVSAQTALTMLSPDSVTNLAYESTPVNPASTTLTDFQTTAFDTAAYTATATDDITYKATTGTGTTGTGTSSIPFTTAGNYTAESASTVEVVGGVATLKNTLISTNTYATLNPLTSSSTLTNGNKTVYNALYTQAAEGNMGIPPNATGRWVYEYKATSQLYNANYFGWTDRSYPTVSGTDIWSFFSGYAVNSAATATNAHGLNPTNAYDGQKRAQNPPFALNDIVALVMDMDIRKVEMFINGVSQGNLQSFTGGTGIANIPYNGATWFPMVGQASGSGAWNYATLAFSEIDMTYFANYNAKALSTANLSTVYPTTTQTLTTNNTSQVSSAGWSDLDSVTITETLNAQNTYYATSFDARTTWKVNTTGAWRSIARLNAATWEYNSNAIYGSTTWTACTTNTQEACLSQAFGLAANQMSGTQIAAISDLNWNATGGWTAGNTIDFATGLKTANAGVTPTIDNIAVNYSTAPRHAAQLYTFDTSAYILTKLGAHLTAFATASAGNGLTAKIWNVTTVSWDTLTALGNTAAAMPTTWSEHSIATGLTNYLDAGKVRILVTSNNPSVTATSAVLTTDFVRLPIWGALINASPNAPTLISPASLAILNTNTPVLSAQYTDLDAGDTGTVNYRIASTTAADCLANLNIAASGTSALTASNNAATTWTPGVSIGVDGTYYWCTQANDGAATSAWTSMGSITLDTISPTAYSTEVNTPTTIAKTLDLDFANMATLDPRVTFTRASTATYMDSAGVIQTAAVNTPRLDHSNPRTNLQNYSAQFDHVAWYKNSGASITADAITAPDGTLTADEWNGTSYIGTANSFAISANTTYTASVYVKAGTATSMIVSWQELPSFADMAQATVNPANGSITATGAGTVTVTDIGNGWYKYKMVGATTGTGTTARFIFTVSNGTAYFWGAQFEVGSSMTDYIPTTTAAVTVAEPQGLLIEEARTNNILQSESIDNASWSKFLSSVSLDTMTAPDGTMTADKLVEDTSAGLHFAQQTVTTTVAPWTLSAYVKAAERDKVEMQFFTGNIGQGFDLTNKTTVALGGVPTSYGMVDVGNGWFRVWITATLAVEPTTVRIFPNTWSYTGDGTSGLYLWGAQLEQGSFPTSYIPTTTAAVTRAADIATVTDLSTIGFNASAGTFLLEANPISGATGTPDMAGVSMSDGTMNNGYSFGYFGTSGASWSAVKKNGVFEFNDSFGNGIVSGGTMFKTAMAYAINDVVHTWNGGPVDNGTDISVALPIGLTTMYIGTFMDGSTAPYTGHISRLSYYPARLTNTELQTITAAMPAHEYTNTASNIFKLAATDTNLSQMRFSCDNVNWSIWETYAASKTLDITAGVTGCTTTNELKKIYTQLKDIAGNTVSTFDAVTYDTTLPALTITDNAVGAWGTTDTVIATLTEAHPSLLKWDYDADGLCSASSAAYINTYTSSAAITVNAAHNDYICFYAEDIAGNKATIATTQLMVDVTTPNIVAVDAGASSLDRTSLTSATWFNLAATGGDNQLSFGWTDPVSASNDTFYYSLSAIATANQITGAALSTTSAFIDAITVVEGTNYLHARSRNGSGTWGIERVFTVNYDKTAPTTSAAVTAGTLGTNSWYTTGATLTITPADANSGVASTAYCIDQSNTCTPITAYTVPIVFSTVGTHYLRYASTDTATNVQTTQSLLFKIDTVVPTIQTTTITSPNGGESWGGNTIHPITWNAADITDATSGVASVTLQYSTDGVNYTDIATGEPNDGTYSWTTPDFDSATVTVRIIAIDAAGLTANDISNAGFSLTQTTTMTTIHIDTGNNQTGGIDETLGTELRVRVSNGFGSYAVAGAVVATFDVTTAPISPIPAYPGNTAFIAGLTGGQTHTSVDNNTWTVATDASGYAALKFNLGDRAGAYVIRAYFGDGLGTKTAYFLVTEREVFQITLGNAASNPILDPANTTTATTSTPISITTNAASFAISTTPSQWPHNTTHNIDLSNWLGGLGFGWDNNGTQATTAAFSASLGNPAATTAYTCSGDTCQGTTNITFDITTATDYRSPAGTYANNLPIQGINIVY